MEKKRYRVEFIFRAEFESETDGEALVDASYALRYGIKETRNLMLRVVSCFPIPKQAKTPAPQELPDTSKSEAETPTAKEDFPF